MKKFRFVLLALGVAAITFAFTPSTEKAPTSTVYAFSATGTLMGSAASESILKEDLCHGPNQQFCTQVWTAKDSLDRPAGTRLTDIQKPN
jgi:hypothetical protein